MRKLLTNCPNCAGILDTNGKCPYCGTHVRYANELDIQAGNFYDNTVEMLINVKRGDETIIYPFVGRMREMTLTLEAYASPSVELIFDGWLANDLLNKETKV